MSAAGVQTLLAHLLTDGAAREEAAAAPEEYARRFGVPVEEVRRLCRDDAPRLHLTAVLTRWKRLTNAEGALPGTMRLCRRVRDDDTILTRVLASADMTTPRGIVRTAHRLGALAAETAADADRRLVADVVRYEALGFEIRSRPRSAVPGSSRGPLLGGGAVLAEFGCPVAEVRRRLIAGAPFDELRDVPTRFVLLPGAGGGIRPMQVSAGVYALLTACDGTTAVTALAERLGYSVEAVDRALRGLRAKGVEIGG
ncbi:MULTISPECIES: hypothetical protein [unclassified Streptomyces]|uniref:hypothetical protein n=1 Tax=unclassified Streptomyces TaxID=2593676 RepID=UPI0036EC7D27